MFYDIDASNAGEMIHALEMIGIITDDDDKIAHCEQQFLTEQLELLAAAGNIEAQYYLGWKQ